MCFVLKTSHIHICDKTRGNTSKQFKLYNDNWKDGNKRKEKKVVEIKKERKKKKKEEEKKKKVNQKKKQEERN